MLVFCPPICSVNELDSPLNRGRLLDFVLFSCSIAYIYIRIELNKLNAYFLFNRMFNQRPQRESNRMRQI